MILTCPNCGSVLKERSDAFKCQNNHSFDKAKDGYVNLLLSNQKKTNNPGDNKTMILAREQFLSKGYYDFLLLEINELWNAIGHIKDSDQFFLDLGCGSGYYTRNVLRDGRKWIKLGVDISKNAISVASKKDKKTTYAVASVFRLPIKDRSVDLILNVFSPVDLLEIKRIINIDGHLIKVIPGLEHMREIAEMVYETFKPHSTKFLDLIEQESELEIVKRKSISQKLKLNADQLREMISMTPYLYKFSKKQLELLEATEVSLSFTIICLKYICVERD